MAEIDHPTIGYDRAPGRTNAPLLLMLVQFPAVCFTLTLVTDVLYRQTENLMWHDFSSWLLFAGLVFGGLAVLTGIVDMVMTPGLRSSRAFWTYALCGLVVLLLAVINSLVHAGDGWTGIVPWGLALSALTVVAMVVTSWVGRSLPFRRGRE